MIQFNKYLFLLTFVTLINCKVDRKETVNRSGFSFTIGDDTYLFFKNVRKVYYDFTDLPKAYWHAYRHGDRYQGSERPSISPVIVVDWMKKEAYILVEPNALLADEPKITIEEVNTKTGVTYQYSLQERGRENMLEFATKIYEGIMAGNSISITHNNVFVPLFLSEDESEAFRVTMADYYRLTRVF